MSTAPMIPIPASSNALIASPNAAFRKQVLETLRSSRCMVDEALGGAEALAKVELGDCQVVLLDKWLPDLDAAEVVETIRQHYPQVEVVVVDSKIGNPLLAEESPAEAGGNEIGQMLGDLQGTASLSDVEAVPEAPLADEPPMPQARVVEPLPKMIGESSGMQQVYRLSRLVAPRTTTVLVSGETGTGKELVARAIHLVSPRCNQPFITVNCAAIPEPLLESELFGYARGAFTGAFQSRAGRIHAAHGGTLFLDEVSELPLGMQAKLLRFLQEGEVQRLGSSDIVRVDVRVIAATNADLIKRVEEKAFREDLYYRISVFPIDITPLRERPEDVDPLSLYFLAGFCREGAVPEKNISAAACAVLEGYRWPGNVRELRHVMERAFILSEQSLEILPEHIRLQHAAKSG